MLPVCKSGLEYLLATTAGRLRREALHLGTLSLAIGFY
jgi:hypothetical protein